MAGFKNSKSNFDNYQNRGFYDGESSDEYYSNNEYYTGWGDSDDWDEGEREEAPKKPSKSKKIKLKKPKRSSKRVNKKYFIHILLIIIAAGIAVLILMNTPIFAIKTIIIEGAEKYTDKEIITMAKVEKGDNIFRTTESRVSKNLKLASSYISGASLKRTLPGTLTISVKERKAVAYVIYQNDYIVMNEDGYILKIMSTAPELTRLYGIEITSAEKNKVIEASDKDQLKTAISLITAMNNSNLFFKKIDISKPEKVKAYVFDKLCCVGSAENLLKVIENNALENIIFDLYQKKIKTGTVTLTDGDYCSYKTKITK